MAKNLSLFSQNIFNTTLVSTLLAFYFPTFPIDRPEDIRKPLVSRGLKRNIQKKRVKTEQFLNYN